VFKGFSLFCVVALLASASAFADSAYLVNVDTSSLAGTSAQLAFDFIDGGPPSNTVTISGFSTDATLGSVFPSGGVSGTLPGTVMLTDSTFFNEYLTDLTLGTYISFGLDVTTNGPDSTSIPDALSVFLLDPTTGFPLVTTSDPTGADSLFTLNIDGTSQGSLGVYTPIVDAIAGSGTTVPEPRTSILLGAGLAFLVWRFEQRRCASKL
jgi:hypothetical protein